MKNYILSCLFLGLLNSAWCCSCVYDPNFYVQIDQADHHLEAVFIGLESYSIPENDFPINIATFQVIDPFSSDSLSVADMIKVFGEDGANCGAWLGEFIEGDTVIMGIEDGWRTFGDLTPFYLGGYCNPQHIILQDGRHGGLSRLQIKRRIMDLLNYNAPACRCARMPPQTFQGIVHGQGAACLGVLLDRGYAHADDSLLTQVAYVVVLDTMGNMDAAIGDTIRLIGENGVNCGALIHLIPSSVDTFLFALSSIDGTSGGRKSYKLNGSCRRHYRSVRNGMIDGIQLADMLALIKSGFSSVEGVTSGADISFYPNPAGDRLFMSSDRSVMHEAIIHDMQGRLVSTTTMIDNLHGIVSLEDVPTGVYFITVRSDDGAITKKFMKN